MIEYTPELAMDICELVASGEPLAQIAQRPGYPSRRTIYNWLARYPKFYDAYERAVEVSATSLEEEALGYARDLAGENDYTGTKVSAMNYAMQQLRWSAARRNKAKYGQQQAGIAAVPIQIITSLNLGQDGMGPAKDIQRSIYTVELEAKPIPAFIAEDPEEYDALSQEQEAVEIDGEVSDNPPSLEDLTGDPVELEPAKEKPKPAPKPRAPRRKPGHKSPGQAAASAKRYANRKKETE